MSLLSSSVAHVVRFTKAKGQGLIAFLRVLVAMDVTKEILPLEKIFGGMSTRGMRMRVKRVLQH